MLILTYVFGGISGGHFNPAVSFGHMVGKNITMVRAVSYTICQCLGASLGATFALNLDGNATSLVNAVAPNITTGQAFGAETIGTFILMYIAMAATDKSRSGKSATLGPLAPLATGMAYFVLHLGMVHIDGCSINPARSFGAANASNEWGDHWVFWAGPLLGALLGAIGYGVFDEAEAEHTEIEAVAEKEIATEIC